MAIPRQRTVKVSGRESWTLSDESVRPCDIQYITRDINNGGSAARHRYFALKDHQWIGPLIDYATTCHEVSNALRTIRSPPYTGWASIVQSVTQKTYQTAAVFRWRSWRRGSWQRRSELDRADGEADRLDWSIWVATRSNGGSRDLRESTCPHRQRRCRLVADGRQLRASQVTDHQHLQSLDHIIYVRRTITIFYRSSRSSQAIDVGADRKRICHFLLVINS